MIYRIKKVSIDDRVNETPFLFILGCIELVAFSVVWILGGY